MGSSRLPGKVMMDLDGKNCLLDYVLNQLTIGSEKATLVADQTINKVRTASGLNYFVK